MKRFAFAAVMLVAFQAAAETRQYIVSTRVPFRQLPQLAPIGEELSGERMVAPFEVFNGFVAELTPEEAATLAASSQVRYVEEALPRYAMGLTPSSNETRNPNGQTTTYGVNMLRAPEVWPVTRGQGVNVVVADTGIDYKHPELAAVYAGGRDFVKNDDDPMDEADHGTHVAGTIAAADNTVGVVGVAPNVKLWAARVLNENGSGTTANIVRALDWVIARKQEFGGNWIVNFSLGSDTSSTSEGDAIRRAIQAGIVVVAASGNESSPELIAPIAYPGAYSGVISVGAISESKTLAGFSNQGPTLSVVAPGVSVLSTIPLGTGFASTVKSGANTLSSAVITGSKAGSVSGEYVFCGLGKPEEIPASVAGKIALIRRGEIRFSAKAKNAADKGAVAVVIINNDDSALSFTLLNEDEPWSSTYAFPVVVAVTKADGDPLVGKASPLTVTVAPDDFGRSSGTSMATPHVAGAAALVWGSAPNATSEMVKDALLSTAKDLGPAGRDDGYGSGVVDALDAAKKLAPSSFGSAVTPPPPPGPVSGRRVLVRGRP